MGNNKMELLWKNRNLIRYKYVVQYEGSSAIISFKYNYKKIYDTQHNQRHFWQTKKEKLENGLKEKENDLNVKKKNKIQKKLHQFENILNMIEQNEEHYFDEQFIPCFEVESEDNALKNRIESILYCVDTALYPISCDFDCVNDFDSVFEDRANNNTKAIELALNQIGIGDVEKEQKENANNENGDVQMETIQNNETEEVNEEMAQTEDTNKDQMDNENENESVGSDQSEKRGQKRKLEVDSKNDEPPKKENKTRR